MKIQRFEIFHDLLAPALLRWSEVYVAEREQKRRRRRLLQWLFASGLALLAVLSYAHSLWLDARPWGTLENLSTGTVHALSGHSLSLGRNTEHTRTEIDIRPHSISRLHARISRDDFRAIDMRSMFGTTVNGEFLPYGLSRPLESGDIVVLGGVVAFAFSEPRYSWLPFVNPRIEHGPPARSWAMLVDGRTRAVTSIHDDRFSIAATDAGLAITDYRSEGAHVDVYGGGGTIPVVTDRADDLPLRAIWKYSDHRYEFNDLRPGQSFSQIETVDGREAKDASIFYATFELGDFPFQIIPNLRQEWLEPEHLHR